MIDEWQGNILTEKLFSVRTDGVNRKETLAGVLFRLMNRENVEFLRVRPHQEEPWFAFLVQLGALCEVLRENPLASVKDFQQALFALAGHSEPAWCLLTPQNDPAFLQPFCEKGWGTDAWTTPDDVDVLITSRAHDVKPRLMVHPELEDWVYALVSVQTTWGYGGVGNYGCLRNRGPYSARMFARIVPTGQSASDSFRREVYLWQKQRAHIRSLGLKGKAALLWTMPWSGLEEESLQVEDLDPFFIEVCRLYKLVKEENGQVVCVRRSAKATRIKRTVAEVGDLWTPILVEGSERSPCALYEAPSLRKTVQILFEAEASASLVIQPEDGPCPILQIRGVSRDPSRQGMTMGYVNVEIPLPYTSDEDRVRMGSRVTTWLAHVHEAQKFFRNLTTSYAKAEAGAGSDSDTRMTNGWRAQLEQQVTDSFWSTLRATKDLEDEDALRQWQGMLAAMLKDATRALCETAPVSTGNRYKAVARALNLVGGFIRNQLPLVAQEESFATAEAPLLEETP
jgi:CRISPR system Cascade subunit CasA